MRNIFIFYPIFVVISFVLTSCTTPKVARPPSTYLLSTEKSQVQLMTELSEMLVANKYEIKNLNSQTGFLLTKPRRFTVKRADGTKTSTEQNLIIRQEGGSITVRANYDCEYMGRNQNLAIQPCNNDDEDVNKRIRRIESALLKQIRKKLEETSTTPEEKDLTADSQVKESSSESQAPQTPDQK